MFHSLFPLITRTFLRGYSSVKLLLHKKMGNWPLLNVQNKTKILDDLFWAWFDHSLEPNVTKHLLSIKHFHSCFFRTFPLFKLSNKDYLLLIFTFIGVIQFWRSIYLSFQSHQIRILSVGLGMARNRETDSPVMAWVV